MKRELDEAANVMCQMTYQCTCCLIPCVIASQDVAEKYIKILDALKPESKHK